MTRGSRATGCLAAAVLLTAGIAGCTDEDAAELTTPPTTLVEGVPVRADATSGPGTDLVAGFSVVEGSVLLGTVFPADYRGSDRGLFDRVTTALLLVTGDARQVFDAYADQAAAIGLPVGPDSSSGLCHEER